MLKKILMIANCVFLSNTLLAYDLPPASTEVKINGNTEILREISRSVGLIAEASKKALVFISVTKTMRGPNNYDPFFDLFGGDPGVMRNQEGFGSGFFVDLEKGYILTNNHVVENADNITVKLANGKSYAAKIIGNDKDTDVAVIQVVDSKFDHSNLASLVLDDSDKVTIGSFVVAIGAPFLLQASVTFGVVSAIGRGNLQLTKRGDFIQTDAAVNPGNSGGPLLNVDGKVIGINSAIYSQSGGYAGVSFAIPANIARRIASALINRGSVSSGYIGIQYVPLRDEWVASLDLPKDTQGIVIAETDPAGPAHGKIEAGDIIVAIDGKEFEPNNVTSIIGFKEPGEKVKLSFYRQGKKNEVTLVVGTQGKQPSVAKQRPQNNSEPVGKEFERFGLRLTSIDKNLRDQFSIKSTSGLVVSQVELRSPAWRAGFQQGDVIISVNGKRLQSIKDFETAVHGKGMVLLQVERKGQLRFAELRAPNP